MKKSSLITRCSWLIVIVLIVLQKGDSQLSNQESNQILYKLEDGKVHSTSDGGSRWEKATTLPESLLMIVWNHQNPEHVIVVGSEAVYVSFYSGRVWMMPWQFPPGFEPTALAISATDSRVVYLTGIVKTPDGSRLQAAWTSRNKGLMWYQLHVPEKATAALADSTKFWFAVSNIKTKNLEVQR